MKFSFANVLVFFTQVGDEGNGMTTRGLNIRTQQFKWLPLEVPCVASSAQVIFGVLILLQYAFIFILIRVIALKVYTLYDCCAKIYSDCKLHIVVQYDIAHHKKPQI